MTRAAGPLVLLCLAAAAALAGPARADFRPAGGWGSVGVGDGQFVAPAGIASNGAGSVWVADAGTNRVQRFGEEGAFLGAFGGPGGGPGQFAGAGQLAADAFGSIYVTDRDNARVEKFGADGAFVLAWGSRGGGDGQFEVPTGVATDSRGNVYVADRQLNRIQRFTPDGAFDLAWGATGTGPGRFLAAEDVAVDVFGDVYVLDGAANQVQKFAADGTHLFGWGSSGAGDGQFAGPLGIASDGVGNVYVADAGNQRVQQFTSDGAFVTSFANGARAVDVSSDASGTAYVVDQAAGRVQRFAEPAPPLPPPQAGKTANIERVSGTVLVRRPHTARFERLTKPRQIPFGSQVQTTRGRAKLITARDLRGGQQAARFRAGLFTIRQRRTVLPVTELRLAGGDFGACPKQSARRSASASRRRKGSRRSVRRLWGDGEGRFRTEGHYGSAGVRGTIWLTEDRCDGTLIRVRRGVVSVRDFARHRTISVRAGRSYLARRGR